MSGINPIDDFWLNSQRPEENLESIGFPYPSSFAVYTFALAIISLSGTPVQPQTSPFSRVYPLD